MPNTAIWFGRLLILLGIAGYVYGLYAGNASLTALIPAAFGIVIMVCGHAAQMAEGARKHLMHVAVLVGLLGFIIPAVRLAGKIGDLSLSAAVVSQLVMILLCLAFVALSVRSFINARRQGKV
ncbi:MAG: hypothetical protein ABJA02_09255 [Acidobacteriota bacterium]